MDCLAGNYVGVDFGIEQDLTHKLPEEWRDFNHEFVPIFLQNWPDKSRVAAGLACGTLWTVAKGMQIGDVVLSPDGVGHYHVGEVVGEYQYFPGGVLPHRRPVRWYDVVIDRSAMSPALRGSTGSVGTLGRISHHSEELRQLIGQVRPPVIVSTDASIEDPALFVMEKHLEDFLVENWHHTELGKHFDIYEDNGQRIGQQYQTDTGQIDILAVSKDRKTLLVVELKKGRASDPVIGQIARYMGFVKDELAEQNQTVRGAVVALEDDKKLRRALSVMPAVDFYQYEIHFSLKRK